MRDETGKRRKIATVARIGDASRALSAFEEHQIKEWHWLIPGLPRANWRAVTKPGEFASPLFGKYECLDCGGQHLLPGLGRALICASLPKREAVARATGLIEGRIARATGQYPKVESLMLSDLANEISHWLRWYPWGNEIFSKYFADPRLGPLLTRDDTPLPDGDNRRPPPNAGEMIFNHLPLVRKYARRRASTVYDEKGWQALDDSLFSDLENIGMEALEAAVHRFDPTRGVTFGAFVRKRVAGAMDDWLNHQRIRYATDGYAARALEGKRSTSDAPKRHRTSTGAYRERVYTEMAVQPRGAARLIPANRLSFDQTMEAALEKLNPRQREVYRGRVLSDPQIPRAVLAARLGIRDEVQIPRIEKQARKKMARLLKVSPP